MFFSPNVIRTLTHVIHIYIFVVCYLCWLFALSFPVTHAQEYYKIWNAFVCKQNLATAVVERRERETWWGNESVIFTDLAHMSYRVFRESNIRLISSFYYFRITCDTFQFARRSTCFRCVCVCVSECGWCWGYAASVASVGVDVEYGVIGAQLPLIISTK